MLKNKDYIEGKYGDFHWSLAKKYGVTKELISYIRHNMLGRSRSKEEVMLHLRKRIKNLQKTIDTPNKNTEPVKHAVVEGQREDALKIQNFRGEILVFLEHATDAMLKDILQPETIKDEKRHWPISDGDWKDMV